MGAQMNIKSAEAVRLAHALRDRTGESLTAAVTAALRERLERMKPDADDLARKAEFERRIQRIAEMQAEFQDAMRKAGVTAADIRQDMEDMYDEDGLPR